MSVTKNTLAKTVDDVISGLREQGLRVTKLRESLVTIFVRQKQPLSVSEITVFLGKENLKPNKSSVYRELDFFLAQKLIAELDILEGSKRYEWRAHHADHHHHIVCNTCGAVECIDLCFNSKEITAKIKQKTGFTVASHILEFFGACAACTKRNSKPAI